MFNFLHDGLFGEEFGFFIGLLCLIDHLVIEGILLEVENGLEEKFNFLIELVE